MSRGKKAPGTSLLLESQIVAFLIASASISSPCTRSAATVGTQTKPNGTFEFKAVTPGSYELDVYSSGSGMDDWYTKAVFAGSQDVLNSGIPVANSDLELDVVLSPKGGVVEGIAREDEQHPATDATVVLIPDPARAKREQLYETASTDQNGPLSNQQSAY